MTEDIRNEVHIDMSTTTLDHTTSKTQSRIITLRSKDETIDALIEKAKRLVEE